MLQQGFHGLRPRPGYEPLGTLGCHWDPWSPWTPLEPLNQRAPARLRASPPRNPGREPLKPNREEPELRVLMSDLDTTGAFAENRPFQNYLRGRFWDVGTLAGPFSRHVSPNVDTIITDRLLIEVRRALHGCSNAWRDVGGLRGHLTYKETPLLPMATTGPLA